MTHPGQNKERPVPANAHLTWALRRNRGRFPKGPARTAPRDPMTKPPRRARR